MVQQMVNLVFLCSNDPDGSDWVLVKPEDVPPEISDPDTLGNMAQGLIAQPPGSHLWYRAMSTRAYDIHLRRNAETLGRTHGPDETRH